MQDQQPPTTSTGKPADHQRRRWLATTGGHNTEAFGATDWALLISIALIWGASFLLIEIALDALQPGAIVWGRIGFGAAVLALLPRARAVRIDRSDWPRIVLLAFVWMAIPLTLFPVAQQWVDSSVPGMINGGMPLMTAWWAFMLTRLRPNRRLLMGLVLGFVGIVAIFLPELPTSVGQGSQQQAAGVALSVAAIFCYGLAANIVVPLQHRYGSTAVLLRAQLVALLVVTPFGLWSLPSSSWSTASVTAVVVLGAVGTGVAFVMMASLVGSVGGPRGATAIYFVPVVALTLGVVVLGEQVHPLAIAGMLLTLAGAWLTSRRERPAPSVGSIQPS